ncbi:MAG: (d)CMP kinase [Myxococcales bacterium]|nr:(d)CMP kinase [Myxococcales bacterium]MBL9112140.1 (d)CMP kinase [Myxococcales bacterium]
MSRPKPVIAIDGPAGAGKSTVARNLAKALGFLLVDTGAIYRAVALAATRRGIDRKDGAAVAQLASDLLGREALVFRRDAELGMRVVLEGDDVSDEIRTPEMGIGASEVSVHPKVREALLGIQRQAGAEGGVVLEGRDIGTVVFPDAELKFFLTASPEVRAQRRHAELVQKGNAPTYEETLEAVRARDHQDESRAVAPLRRAADAVLVDSSALDFDGVVAEMLTTVRAKLEG